MIVHLIALLSALALCACATDTQPSSEAGELIRSSRGRDSSPSVRPEDLAAFATGESDFAWELFQEAKDDPENLFFSPYSLYVSLGMTWAGARGDTASEMAEVLHFAREPELTHSCFNALDLALKARATELEDSGATPFVLRLTQALFGQAGNPLAEPFLDTLAQHYDAGVSVLDFGGAPEDARLAINRWVGRETEGRIEELLRSGSIDTHTALVLANTVYFQAPWAMPFDPSETSDAPFSRLDGTQVLVPTMHRFGRTTEYAKGEGYQAVSLDYDGGSLRMVFVVPDEGRFEAVQDTLNASTVREIRDSLKDHDLDLSLPKFGFTGSLSVKAKLKQLGMVRAFTEAADFSGISSVRPLQVDEAVQEAFVSIDELGTEAGAATGIVIRQTSLPPRAQLFIDRPFIFFVEDRQTGVSLFIGRVLDPSS